MALRCDFRILVLLITVALIDTGNGGDGEKNERRFVSINLQNHANLDLDTDFHVRGNNMKTLPRGKQKLGDVEFNIGEKYIHLAGKRAPEYPKKAEGIPVNRRVLELHFLQGGGWGTVMTDGTPVGEYIVHYDDSTSVHDPIVYGFDIRDWWMFDHNDVTRAVIAWRGLNHATKDFQGMRLTLRLIRRSWVNPNPEKIVTSVDFVSFNETICSPFLIAASAESLVEDAGIDEVNEGEAGNIETLKGTVRETSVLEIPDAEEPSAIVQLREIGAFLEYKCGRLMKVSLSGPGPRRGRARGTDDVVALVSSQPTVEFLDVAWSSVTDAALISAKELPNLRLLNLNLTSISDKALIELKDVRSLERLWLHRTRVTDEGLSNLSLLSNLRILDLSETNISDTGLSHLESLTSLEELDLRGTQTTETGVAALRQSLPKTQILQ